MARKAPAVQRPAVRKRRGQYHHGDLRRALVDAAIWLVEHRGREGFTLREAARITGVNHRAAYRHFRDKSALLAEVSEEGFRELGDRMEAAASSAEGTPLERLRAMASAYIRFALERPSHYRVMFGPRLAEAGRFQFLETAATRCFELARREVRAAVGQGESLSRDLTVGFFVITGGYCELALSRRIPVDSPAQAEKSFFRVLSCLIEAARTPPPTAS